MDCPPKSLFDSAYSSAHGDDSPDAYAATASSSTDAETDDGVPPAFLDADNDFDQLQSCDEEEEEWVQGGINIYSHFLSSFFIRQKAKLPLDKY